MTEAIRKERADGDPAEKAAARGFRLLDEAGEPPGATVRDDQHPFPWLLDAAGRARRRGRRFRLVDSGKLEARDLEWLAAAGADLFTADDIRPVVFDLVRLGRTAEPSGAYVAFFHHGPLDEGEEAGRLGPDSLGELLRSGVDVHISNRERSRPANALRRLALSRIRDGAELVYYHHGALSPEAETPAEEGAWVHVGDNAIDLVTDSGRIRDLGRATRSAGGGIVLHVEKETDSILLDDLSRAGVHVLDKRPGSRSPRGRSLPGRSFYLDTTFLP